MEQFAKLFEINGEQALVTKTFENDEYKVTIRTHFTEPEFKGVIPEVSICLKTEGDQNKMFNAYDIEKTKELLDSMKSDLLDIFSNQNEKSEEEISAENDRWEKGENELYKK